MDRLPTHASGIYALEAIQTLPLLLDQPRCRYYPGMKLGYLPHMHFFSRQLCDLAIAILQRELNAQSTPDDWVLTAPAYYRLPAAANLLARDIQLLLQQKQLHLPLIEPRLSQQQVEIRNQEDLTHYNDYSKNTIHQRIVERQRVQQTIDTDILLPQFRNKSVIVINDINVTGTQQTFMQQRFDQLQVRQCVWLYIFTIDKPLALRHPDIEHQLNNSQWQSPAAFAELLGDKNTVHTARCLGRLLNEDNTTFLQVINNLDQVTRQQLYQLAQQEGRYNSPLFTERMQQLAGLNAHRHVS